MTIREATPADRDAVLQLIRSSSLLPQWRAADLAGAGQGDAQPLQRHLFVATCGPDLLGFAQISVVLEDAELEGMAVYPAQQRKGVGRALLRRCLLAAREVGASMMRLEVRSGNAGAIALYRAEGIDAVGTRCDYYQGPTEDALLMERTL